MGVTVEWLAARSMRAHRLRQFCNESLTPSWTSTRRSRCGTLSATAHGRPHRAAIDPELPLHEFFQKMEEIGVCRIIKWEPEKKTL